MDIGRNFDFAPTFHYNFSQSSIYTKFFVFLHRASLKCLNTPEALARSIGSVVPSANLEDFGVKNEPVFDYLKGSAERAELEKALKETAATMEEIPIVIGDKEYKTKDIRHQVMPHNHKKKIAQFYYADNKLVQKAIDTAVETQRTWDRTPLNNRYDSLQCRDQW